MVHSVHFEIPQSHVTPLHTGPPQTPRHLTVPQLPHIPGRDHLELEPGGNEFFGRARSLRGTPLSGDLCDPNSTPHMSQSRDGDHTWPLH